MADLRFKIFNVHTEEGKPFYSLAKGWWKTNRWELGEIPLLTNLPPTGIMIYDDGKPTCIGWVSKSDSTFAEMGFIVADGLPTRNKPKALSFLIKTAEQTMLDCGFTILRIVTTSNSISRIIARGGYSGQECHEFFKKL
jgi:hypothetical protein